MQLKLLLLVVSLIFLLILPSCTDEIVPEVFQPRTDHEAYLHSLNKADLVETALGKDWQDASLQCLADPIMVSAPYQEAFYFDPKIPQANGYRFSAKRGHKIQIDVDAENLNDAKLFIDLYRVSDQESDDPYVQVASADQVEFLLGFEPKMDANYILRVQPELLRGGRFNLTIETVSALRFPVEGGDKNDIGSFFGDPRDGGRRKHHGVDIFAKRHTPILAPTDGFIRFVGERGLGGQVVWMRDRERDMTLYFAHLQTIIAKDDTWVKAGDTLGTIGNTGNARTTPPHLHFGIYQNGPIDPYYFVANLPSRLKPIRANQDLLGQKARTIDVTTLIHVHPDSLDQKQVLDQFQLLDINAAIASHYMVSLPDGTRGKIRMQDIEPLLKPISPQSLSGKFMLLDEPRDKSAIIEEINGFDNISVLGKNKNHWYVQSDSGNTGWIAQVGL